MVDTTGFSWSLGRARCESGVPFLKLSHSDWIAFSSAMMAATKGGGLARRCDGWRNINLAEYSHPCFYL